MNRSTRTRRITLAATATLALALALTACGDDGDSTADETSAAAPKAPATEDRGGKSEASQAVSGPFGPACAAVPKEGKGSFDGMAQDPVATAASNNPELSTLVTAVKKAGLVDTLNNAQGITVFAPTNAAFAKIPKDQLDAVLADKDQLTQILTYHVVGKKLSSAQLAKGTYPTLQKSELTTSGSDQSYTVNDSAKVVCGNVPTANATVYIIDTVLMPEK